MIRNLIEDNLNYLLCHLRIGNTMPHNGFTAAPTAVRGESRKLQTADDRQQAVFFRPHAMHASMGGPGGGAFVRAGFRLRRSLNPVMCPPTSFESEERVPNLQTEARNG